jgi:hypothetical protein
VCTNVGRRMASGEVRFNVRQRVGSRWCGRRAS